MKRRFAVALALVSCLALAAPRAQAMINPNFTPIHLVNQSAQILQVEVGVIAGNKLPLKCLKAIKGDATAPSIELEKVDKPILEPIEAMLGKSAHAGLLFVGEFKEARNEEAGDDNQKKMPEAFLHVEGVWIPLARTGPQSFTIFPDRQAAKYQDATFAGGTEMLARCVQYILADPDASVPCATESNWAAPVQIGQVGGRITGAMPIDLKSDGQISLFVQSADGDRIFSPKHKSLADATAQLKLGAKSLSAAWGDFTNTGRLSLASWDGSQITIWEQAADGTFSPKPLKIDPAIKECLGLATIDAGNKAGLLVSTSAAPILVVDGKAAPIGQVPAGFTSARACVVADLDGDGLPDVLQPFEAKSLLYKGQGSGKFAPPAACEIFAGEVPAGICTGDFDADGLLDVFVAGKGRCYIWQNLGGGKFVESMGNAHAVLSGEAAYITKGGGFFAQVCDINNDGRQDFFIAYTDRAPHLFFNRGFRSFGHSHSLDLEGKFVLEAANGGVAAGVIADFNADGHQDMALVLKNGEVHLIPRDAGDRAGLAVRAATVPWPFAGPLNITATIGARPLGAWQIQPGQDAFIGRPDPGPIALKWQYPGSKPQETKIVVEDLTRCTLGAEGIKR